MPNWITHNITFLIAIVGAWAWFTVAPRRALEHYHLSIRTNIPGWQFEHIPLSQETIKKLATTNLLNGNYHSQNGERFSVFLGDWSAESAGDLDVLAHTPDICWIGAGWIPVPSELTNFTSVLIGEQQIGFQRRIFCLPNQGNVELCLWVSMIDGKSFTETSQNDSPASIGKDNRIQIATIGRKLASGFFLNSISRRIPANKKKQFLRISMGVEDRPASTAERINQIAKICIDTNLESR